MHELYEKIRLANNHDIESIIIEWLERKEKEIVHYSISSSTKALSGAIPVLNKILGLDPKPSPAPDGDDNKEFYKTGYGKPEPERVWCSHMRKIGGKWIFFQVHETDQVGSEDWDICPMKGCHVPRPADKPRTLADKFNDMMTDEKYPTPEELEEVANKHFREKIMSLAEKDGELYYTAEGLCKAIEESKHIKFDM